MVLRTSKVSELLRFIYNDVYPDGYSPDPKEVVPVV
jgi:hypothetical protein